MSTRSGPYEVIVTECGAIPPEVWSYQHDMMGDVFHQGEAFYVWGPNIYMEVPRLPDVPYQAQFGYDSIPREVMLWLDRWPETPETNP